MQVNEPCYSFPVVQIGFGYFRSEITVLDERFSCCVKEFIGGIRLCSVDYKVVTCIGGGDVVGVAGLAT